MATLEKITIELKKDAETIGVCFHYDDGRKVIQKNSEQVLSTLWAKQYTTGWLTASQDGLIYLEENEGKRVVVVQRGYREKQPITWNDHVRPIVHEFSSPWTVFLWRLSPYNGGWRREKEVVYATNGTCRGPTTPLFSAEFTGNVYPGGNICWGNTAVAPGEMVSIPSLVNIANDFYTMPFTNHIRRDVAGWRNFTATKQMEGGVVKLLGGAVTEMWR